MQESSSQNLITLSQSKKQTQISCVFQDVFSSCFGNMYISNYQAASNLELLKKHNIKAIISYAKGMLLSHDKGQIPNYLYIPVEDIESYSLKDNYDIVYEFMEKNRKKTNVLVHCASGKSRSVAIVIFYLMKKYQYKCSEAFDIIRRAKPNIKPNFGFLRQLNQLNFQLFGAQDRRFREIIQNFNIKNKMKNQQKLQNNQRQNNLSCRAQNQNEEEFIFVCVSPQKNNHQKQKSSQGNWQQINVNVNAIKSIHNQSLYVSPERRKSLNLIAQKLKKQSQQIQDRIFQIRKTIQTHEDRKRTKSQYLRKRLSQARQNSLKKREANQNTSKSRQENHVEYSFNNIDIKQKQPQHQPQIQPQSIREDILNKKYGMNIQQNSKKFLRPKKLYF